MGEKIIFGVTKEGSFIANVETIDDCYKIGDFLSGLSEWLENVDEKKFSAASMFYAFAGISVNAIIKSRIKKEAKKEAEGEE